MAPQGLSLAVMLHPDHSPAQQEHMATLAGRLGFEAVHVPVTSGESLPQERLERLITAAAPALVVLDDGTAAPGLVRGRHPALVARERARLDASDDRRPVIVALPVSLGRTRNEAVARAARDPRFADADHPQVCGIFGTLEQGQQQVLELARAGAGVLLVTVADDLDVADLLAQVRALVSGPVALWLAAGGLSDDPRS